MYAKKICLLSCTCFFLAALSACSGPGALVNIKPASNDAAPQNLELRLQHTCRAGSKADKLSLFQALLEQEKYAKAQQVNQCLTEDTLSAKEHAALTIAQAKLALAMQEIEQAAHILQAYQLRQEQALLPIKQQNQLDWLQARIFEVQGNYLAGAQQRAFNHSLLDPDQQIQNRAKIWKNLMVLDTETLKQALNRTREKQLKSDWQGWLELALIAKAANANLDQQIEALTQWQNQWPQHIAKNPFPPGINELYKIATGRAQHIAILLPQSGHGSHLSPAILQGLMAAYYQQKQQYQPLISVYDSNQQPILQTLQLAVDNGAELIIGPLLKENLAQLQSLPGIPVPVLALNSLAQQLHTPNLFQISLAIENEAEQAADIALREGKQRALLLNSNKAWSQRAGEAFEQHWLSNDANIVAIEKFQLQDLKTGIRRALELDKSASRFYAVRQVTQLDIEQHKPHRRRQDIDVIFMAATQSEAKRLKPLLNHYRSKNIPVYSTSKIHKNNKPQTDLETIHFTEIPWLLEDDKDFQALRKNKKSSHSMKRLQALGIDSYNLSPRLNYMKSQPHIHFRGRSGEFSMLDNGLLLRKLDWAVYERKQVKKLTPPVIIKTPKMQQNNSEVRTTSDHLTTDNL